MDMSVEGGGKGGFVGGATVLNYNRRRLQDVSCLESNEERSYSCVLELHLCFNYITEVPAGTLSPYSQLSHLSLSCNNLTSLPPSLAAHCPQLRSLRAPNNHITTTAHLEGLACLEYLDLRYNRISRLDNLISLTALKELSVSDNMVEEVVWSQVPSVPSLTFLGIYGNKLTNFDDIIVNLSQKTRNLNRLNIGCNPFCKYRQLSVQSVLLLTMGHLSSALVRKLYDTLGSLFTSASQERTGDAVLADVEAVCSGFASGREGGRRLREVTEMLLKLKANFPSLETVDEHQIPHQ